MSNPKIARRLAVPLALAALVTASGCSDKGPYEVNAASPATTVVATTVVAPPPPTTPTTVVVPTTISTSGSLGSPLPAHPTAGSCDDNGDPHGSSSTWTELFRSHDNSTTNPTGTVASSFGITDADILRIVFEVDLPHWQAQVNPSSFYAYLFPENSGPSYDKNIYYAGPYPPPAASGAQTVGNQPGITSGSRLLPLPYLPAGHGLFKLQFYAEDAAWDFAIQRCDDSGSPSF